MANEIYKANDVQLRQQIKAHLDEADSDISALDTRVTQNESDIDDLEAADVVLDARVTQNESDISDLQDADDAHDDRLDVLEGYRPAMMQFNGSNSYYSGPTTTSGNAVTLTARFIVPQFTGGSDQYLIHLSSSGTPITAALIVVSSDSAGVDFRNKLVFVCQAAGPTNIARLISATNLTDGVEHTVFASYNATTGAAMLIVDGQNEDDTGNASRVLTTGTLGVGAAVSVVGATTGGLRVVKGSIGFVGARMAYLTNWSDFMEADGAPKPIDETSWTQWGAQPLLWNPHGQMDRNLGSSGVFSETGTIRVWHPGFQNPIGLELAKPAAGNFTPTIWDDSLSDSEGQTYTVQLGRYRKMGDTVWYWIDIAINSLGTLTGANAARIGNLPFTSNSAINFAGTVGYANSLAITAGHSVSCYVVANSTRIGLTKFSAATGVTNLTITELSTGGRIICSGFYYV